jgi:hypothetical protein
MWLQLSLFSFFNFSFIGARGQWFNFPMPLAIEARILAVKHLSG